MTKPASSYYLTYKPNANYAGAVMAGDYIYAAGVGSNLENTFIKTAFYRYKADFTI